VRFDLQGKLPDGAILTNASLTFHTTKIRNDQPVRVNLHRMNLSWNEGIGGKGATTGAGDQALAGESSWKSRIAPNVPWSAPGASAPTDFSPELSATSTAGDIGAFTFQSTPQLLTDIQGWLQNPASNFGWIAFCEPDGPNGSAKRIGTREDVETAPSLLLEYEIPKPVLPLSVDLTPSADTYLFEQKPENNFGASTTLRVGTTAQSKRARPLIQFRLEGILPSNAVITNATLAVTVTKAPTTGGKPSALELHTQRFPWIEGAQADLTAATGEPSWNQRATGSLDWTSPGAAAGEDFEAIPVASTPVSNPGPYTFLSNTALIQQLQEWVRSPLSNYGWLLLSDSESSTQTARELASRESGSTGPKLHLGYFLINSDEIPQIAAIQAIEGKLQLSIRIAPTIQAVLEESQSLTVPVWRTVLPLTGKADNTPLAVEIPASSENHFYQVRVIGRSSQ
jgi:hypothetical protein